MNRVGYRSSYGYYTDLNRVPCTGSLVNPAATCGTPQEPLNSTTGTRPVDLSTETRALFTELNLPVFPTLNVQAALRDESYGGSIGVLLNFGRFNASVEYRFDFKDAIVAPSHDAIATAVVPTADGIADCAPPLRERILFDTGSACVQGVTTGANILRLRADLTNGPPTETSGLDVDASIGFPPLGGNLDLSGNATYVLKYAVGSTTINDVLITPGYDAEGFLNDGRGGNPLP